MCAPTPCPETCRMEAGQDIIAKQSQTSLKTNVKTKKKAKTKKPTMDIYRDGDESETYDTKYVLEQMQISEQSLRVVD